VKRAIADRVWEWHWDSGNPIWWVVAAWAFGVVILVIAVWALVSFAPVLLAIVGAVLGIRWLARRSRRAGGDAAMAILRERYARGEIDREEFEARRRDLES
jgi:putative membrane protein